MSDKLRKEPESIKMYRRPWNPLPGHTPPAGEVYIATDDTGKVGSGTSYPEALDRLFRILKRYEDSK